MKAINLLSMVEMATLPNDICKNFLELNKIQFRENEIKGIRFFIQQIISINPIINLYDDFYVGYEIPQIGKEFDLLRFGTNFNINIELKSNASEEKIKKQLLKNKFYLRFLNIPTHYITLLYDEINNIFKFYQLSDTDELLDISTEKVIELLQQQNINQDLILDKQFSPSNYLVSPFNSSDDFLNEKYFLTQNQEEIKTKILGHISDNVTTFMSLTGTAGTGKTLLTYNIAHNLIKKGRKILIIHCGQLNEGHYFLQNNDWNIIPIKSIESHLNTEYDILLLDEAQRIRVSQFNKIIEQISQLKKKCIFSFDKKQTLNKDEKRNNIADKINHLPKIQSFSLTEKIRTNKEIADFIKGLFDKNRNDLKIYHTGNIEILYFSNITNAINYINQCDESWKKITFTSSQYTQEYHKKYSLCLFNSDNSHKVIGQEFDNVIITIDENFMYDSNGKLIYDAYIYYDAVGMLFQNITRVRTKLKIVIINNPIILQRCLELFKTES